MNMTNIYLILMRRKWNRKSNVLEKEADITVVMSQMGVVSATTDRRAGKLLYQKWWIGVPTSSLVDTHMWHNHPGRCNKKTNHLLCAIFNQRDWDWKELKNVVDRVGVLMGLTLEKIVSSKGTESRAPVLIRPGPSREKEDFSAIRFIATKLTKDFYRRWKISDRLDEVVPRADW